jgi:hypothetical protein
MDLFIREEREPDRGHGTGTGLSSKPDTYYRHEEPGDCKVWPV